METRASYILVGSFVLALAAAAAIFVVWLAKGEIDSQPTRYAIYVTGSVTGLQIGGSVLYRGVPVGRVSEIKIDPEDIGRIKVVIEVESGTPIKEDTVATLALQGITGVAFVQLTGGTQTSPPLQPKQPGALPEIRHETSGLEQVLEKAPELFTKAVLVADRLSQLVDNDNLAAVRDTLKNIQNISGVLADRTKSLDGLVKDLGKMVRDVSLAARKVDDLATQLKRDTAPVTGNAEEAMKDLQAALKASRGTLQSISKVSDELRRLVSENRRPLHDFSSGGLYEFGQFVAEARLLVANLTRLTAQIERDPARFFFGDTQKGFEAK